MIITKIFECDNRIIQKQFTRCISTIARLDYPEKWPTLLSNDILSYLNSQNEKGIYTGLLALHALVQKYEFCLEEEREPLLLVIDQSFGVLGGLINHLMAHTESDVALQILHMICKVFFSSNQLQVAPFLTEGENIAPWIGFFNQLLNLPISASLCTLVEDMDEISQRDKSI
jgi:hypothetical protein